MSQLHRTQIYLEDAQIERLKLEAAKTRMAMSELIRRAIDAFFLKQTESLDWNRDPLVKAIGKIRLPADDASVRHDFYLYGDEKAE